MSAKKKGKRNPRAPKRYSVDFKHSAVKLYLEEGYPRAVVAEELGIGPSTLSSWCKRYREEGVAGLKDRPSYSGGRRQIEEAVKAKAVEVFRRFDHPAEFF